MRENVPLAPFTTLGIGGPALYFYSAASVADLQAALDWARDRDVPALMLGGGSNMLIADAGYPGLVVQITIRGMRVGRERDYVTIEAAAGEIWDRLVAFTVENNLAGMECLSGIPGFVGATPIQNVGAYGQDVSQTIQSVQAFDRRENRIKTFSQSECEFSYRQSRFKSREIDRYVILSVTYRLLPNAKPCVLYPDVQRYLAENGMTDPTLTDVREAVIAVRRRKAMVLDPHDPDSRSAGSFFTNPIVSEREHETFLERVRTSGVAKEDERIPTYPAGPGKVKLSAAWLIEKSGFHKGFLHGNVGISTKHSLAIVNRGSGTALEVRELVRQIQSKVWTLFGVRIEPEPNFIGF